MNTAEKIRQNFIEYVLEKNEKPKSVYQLTKQMQMKEEEFYEHFSSLEALEQAIWLGFFEETKKRIESEDVYAGYSVREKVLAFYFTWLEVLKVCRSYVVFNYRHKSPFDLSPHFLKTFKKAFKDFTEELVLEGRESQEIADRRFITEVYPRVFWLQAMGIWRFWVKDTSPNFEKTDVFIEKAVNFGFDAMGSNMLDSSFDLFKFAFQNR
ncbi:MAG: TetR family transcriptional regulator C-terminal domain-containing protein [Microscillaceae bacterium]|jgi:AcrR family transcriptional regulator|nr:TetR family transcriptional regulator C-terminal domain-containing protein [Microscillaceae bacterium]